MMMIGFWYNNSAIISLRKQQSESRLFIVYFFFFDLVDRDWPFESFCINAVPCKRKRNDSKRVKFFTEPEYQFQKNWNKFSNDYIHIFSHIKRKIHTCSHSLVISAFLVPTSTFDVLLVFYTQNSKLSLCLNKYMLIKS